MLGTDTLALLPLVKRQVFCVGDRLKMDKHKAWATTIVAPKSVGSSTTKGQMKPAFRVSLTASQAGENGQIHAPEHTNISSILTYPTFRRNQGRRTAPSGPTIESAKQPRIWWSDIVGYFKLWILMYLNISKVASTQPPELKRQNQPRFSEPSTSQKPLTLRDSCQTDCRNFCLGSLGQRAMWRKAWCQSV